MTHPIDKTGAELERLDLESASKAPITFRWWNVFTGPLKLQHMLSGKRSFREWLRRPGLLNALLGSVTLLGIIVLTSLGQASYLRHSSEPTYALFSVLGWASLLLALMLTFGSLLCRLDARSQADTHHHDEVKQHKQHAKQCGILAILALLLSTALFAITTLA
jgi:hypothetical protein